MNVYGRYVLSLLFLAGGVGGYLWMGEPVVETRRPDATVATSIVTAIAQEHTGGIQFEVDGVVVAFRQIQIAAQVSGRVEFKADACRIGRAVQKGDLLLRIEQDDYEIEVNRLTEEVTQADAMLGELDAEVQTSENQIASAREQLKIDVRDLARSQDLVDRGVTSDSEVDVARRAELASRNSLQTLIDQKNLLTKRRVRLESAKVLGQTNLEKSVLALRRTEIYSPIDGVVVGESVEQDGFVQLGSPVINLQDTSQLDVTCKLHMQQMHWLWQGLDDSSSGDDQTGDLAQAYVFPKTPAKIIYSMGGTSYEWQGVVSRFDGAGIDSQTRMIPCRVHVGNPLSVESTDTGDLKYSGTKPPTLMTGMFVKVRIDAHPPIPLVRLPQQSIQPGNKIWTVVDNTLQQKKVSIANSDPEFVIAYQQADGLQAGDVVVVSPLATPFDGLVVVEAGSAEARGRPEKTAAKESQVP